MEMSTPTVHVLLPTYNGARYLRQQLDSLTSQDYPHLSIHIRDDGSTDATPAILEEFARNDPRVHVTIGKNIGVNHSFYTLLKAEVAPHDLFAFCDQDDVWLRDKIASAVDLLMRQPDPESSLYVARQQFADEQLTPLAVQPVKRRIGLFNAVVESSLYGCTMVFGGNIRKSMLMSQPSDWYSHDWWIYLVAGAFGTILYDSEPRMLYRRHTTNVSGWDPGLVDRIKKRVLEFAERHRTRNVGLLSLRQAERFLETYRDQLSEDHISLIAELVDMRKSGTLFKRLRYAIHPRIHRESWIEDMGLRLMVVLKQH